MFYSDEVVGAGATFFKVGQAFFHFVICQRWFEIIIFDVEARDVSYTWFI